MKDNTCPDNVNKLTLHMTKVETDRKYCYNTHVKKKEDSSDCPCHTKCFRGPVINYGDGGTTLWGTTLCGGQEILDNVCREEDDFDTIQPFTQYTVSCTK